MFLQLLQEVEFLFAQQRHFRARGVHFIIEHHDHEPGTLCAPGEMIANISLSGPEPRSLGLAHTSLLLMDCLFRYRVPLSARRIEEIMNSDPFYVYYAANRIGRNQVIARPDRHNVRVYYNRICRRLEAIIRDLGLNIDLHQILVTEMTDSNATVYRLKATFEIVHVDY